MYYQKLYSDVSSRVCNTVYSSVLDIMKMATTGKCACAHVSACERALVCVIKLCDYNTGQCTGTSKRLFTTILNPKY